MKFIVIIIVIFFVCSLCYYNRYEHMTDFGPYIDQSVNNYINKMQHYDVCQIQQPQLGKGRPYVNWQKIHNYGDMGNNISRDMCN